MEPLLTTKEAGMLIGYSEYSLRKSRCENRKLGGVSPPKYIKLANGTIRYRKSDLEEWLKNAQSN